MPYARYAVFYLPPDGPLAKFGARWLGWDAARGCEAAQFDLPGLQDITETPHKYGFHGTLKPPFRLVAGCTLEGLRSAVARLAASRPSARCNGLELVALGRFLALVPTGGHGAMQQLAEGCVRDLDVFRAPASAAELARRRKANLSARQTAHLVQWGYPFVMEDFRFHMTLTGRLPRADLDGWREQARRYMPALPEPFVIDQIALCGARGDGRFEEIERFALIP